MHRLIATVLGACLLVGGVTLASAQEMAEGTMPPPKVLVIFREFVKPGKSGALHEKSEASFVAAMRRAKWPTRYLTVTSLSGRSRALFLLPYDSFDAWEKDNLAIEKNSQLSADMEKSMEGDGDLLSDTDQTVATYSEEFSLRPNIDIAHMRYFEISLFRVKPGHREEWGQLVKLVIAAYQKIPDAHWATYEVQYGQEEGPTYIVFSGLKAASEIDKEADQDKQFMAAMGEDGMKKLGDLESSAIQSDQTNLFSFSPSMSYVPDEWVKADPTFWKPKMMAPGGAMKKPPAKPAQ
jgi:hypothetical protein